MFSAYFSQEDLMTMIMENKKTAVIYARVSSVGDRQNTERQVRDLTEYAQANNYQVKKGFEEHISGAVKNESRVILSECLSYCIDNHIDTLLVSELSRLGRNVDEVLATVKFAKDNHLSIYFQKEGLSLFNADGTKNPFLTIFISVLGTCAELERDSIKFRLNSGRKRYIDAGGRLGRKVGYRKPANAKLEEYKEALKLLRQGYSIRKTAKLSDTSVSTVARLKREFSL